MPLIKAPTPTAQRPARTGAVDGDNLDSALLSPDLEVRRTAIRAAVQRDDMAPLLAHLSHEPDQSVREVILNSVVRRQDVTQVPPLMDLLRSEDAPLRNAVIEALQMMGDATLPEIERRLGDPDVDVRIFCVNILQAIRVSSVPDIALRVAMTDQDVNVCVAAVDILAELGRPDMAEALGAVAARFPQHPFLAFAVRAALRRVG